MNELIDAYNDIIRPHFPAITCIPGRDELVYALNVSDADGPAFAKFILDGLGDALRAKGFQFQGVVTFSPAATRVKFPEAWEVIQSNKLLQV